MLWIQDPHHSPAADKQNRVEFKVCHLHSVFVNIALMGNKEVNSERRQGVGAVERKKKKGAFVEKSFALHLRATRNSPWQMDISQTNKNEKINSLIYYLNALGLVDKIFQGVIYRAEVTKEYSFFFF